MREAKLLKATVIKEIYATYAILPVLTSIVRQLKLNGRRFFWPVTGTATGWPATMEGAVRSGYLAAGSVDEKCGTQSRICRRRLACHRIHEALLVNIRRAC